MISTDSSLVEIQKRSKREPSEMLLLRVCGYPRRVFKDSSFALGETVGDLNTSAYFSPSVLILV